MEDNFYFLCSIDKLWFPSISIFSFLFIPISSFSQIAKGLCSSYSLHFRHLLDSMKKTISSYNTAIPIDFSAEDII